MTVSRVSSGQVWAPRPVGEENQIVDAANWVNAHRRGDTFDRPAHQRDWGIVFLRNDSGYDLSRGHNVTIGDPLISTEPTSYPQQYLGRPIHKGIKPSHPGGCGYLAVADEAIGKSKIGRFVVSGLCVAYVDIKQTWHEWADVSNKTSRLHSYPAGAAHIEWHSGATGVQLCLIRIGTWPEDLIRFETTSRFCRGLSATAKILWGGQAVTIYDPLQILCPCCEENCVDQGAFGLAKYWRDKNRYELITIQCTEGSSSPPSSESSTSSSSSTKSSSTESSSTKSSSTESSGTESSSESRCPCPGTCYFVAVSSGGNLQWSILAESTCTAPCSCDSPASAPNYVGELGYGSCWGPCGSSSSSSESTSQPPCDPCLAGGTCTYQGQCVIGPTGVVCSWVFFSRTCVAPCYCDPPADPPFYHGQISYGICCGPGSSSSSSSGQSISQSSTSAAGCSGTFMWEWSEYTHIWYRVSGDCVGTCEEGGDCSVLPPTELGAYHGEIRYTYCDCY